MKCAICGSDMILRTRLSGEKSGLRYWVCSRYPECKEQKSFAEQGAAGKYHVTGRIITFR